MRLRVEPGEAVKLLVMELPVLVATTVAWFTRGAFTFVLLSVSAPALVSVPGPLTVELVRTS